MTEGLPSASLSNRPGRPPEDSGEALGLTPSQLTITFGFGPSCSRWTRDRFGLAEARPNALAQIPPMPGDALDPALAAGTCSCRRARTTSRCRLDAIRTLIRIAEGAAVVRWRQLGFGRTARTSRGQQTPRNLQGFKDGTDNILSEDARELDQFVWLGSGDLPGWAQGGTTW